MFSEDRNIENLGQLYTQIKRYLSLQKEYARLELVEKLSLLLSTLLIVFVAVALGLVALFYLMFAVAYLLAPAVGGLPASFAILGGVCLLLILLVYLFRKQLIVKPLVRFLALLFLNDRKHKTEE